MKKIIKRTIATSLALSTITTNVVAAPIQWPPVLLPYQDTIDIALETATTMMEATGLTGMTIALVDAETGFTWTQGLGYADTINNIPVDQHTLFQIGSTSKPFTAIAIMQLVEQGLIDLDEPLVTYIPEFSLLPNFLYGGNSDDITVRMLLNNTSGIPANRARGFITTGSQHYQGAMNDLLDWFIAPVTEGVPQELIPTLVQELMFEPGTQFEYANNGWTLLGILVSRIMGNDNYFEGFIEYTAENIFAPIGMNRSTFQFTEDLTNIAMPHLANGTQDDMHLVGLLSAGSMMSSAYDMARFMHTILGDGTIDGNRLLDQETISYMLLDQTGNVETTLPFAGYGLGFLHMNTADGFATVGHGGNIHHYHTEMVFNQETGIGVFVSTNSVMGAVVASPVALAILQAAVYEKTGELPLNTSNVLDPEAVAIELSDTMVASLQALEGAYDFGQFGIWEMQIIDGVLTWIMDGNVLETIAMSDGSFDSEGGRYVFTYELGQAYATLFVAGIELVAERITVNINDTNIEVPTLPEDFEQWIGTYNFFPIAPNEVVGAGLPSQLTVSLNEDGLLILHMITPLTEELGIETSAIPLTYINGRWIIEPLGNQPFQFNRYNDVFSVYSMGGHWVREN